MGPITFVVFGKPEPKGSTRSFRLKTGAVVTTSDNPRLKGWASLVIDQAVETFAGRDPYDCPISVRVCFDLARPAGHFGKKGLLPSAPSHPATLPDLDKLVRGLLDGLTQAGVWRDDSRVVAIDARKEYGDTPGAIVTIQMVEP
jgi:crossover junction endodeoxyribonuclease RusA